MKRVIVILFVMLLVAGGGAGGLIMLGIVPNPFNPKVAVNLSAAEKAAAAAGKNKFQPPVAAFTLIKVPDLIIPVIENGRVQRRVFITVRIMASAKTYEKDIKEDVLGGKGDAHVGGRFIGTVIGELVPFFQAYFAQHDTLDLPLIKEKMVGYAKQVYGNDAIKDVLLMNAFEQPAGGLPPQ